MVKETYELSVLVLKYTVLRRTLNIGLSSAEKCEQNPKQIKSKNPLCAKEKHILHIVLHKNTAFSFSPHFI